MCRICLAYETFNCPSVLWLMLHLESQAGADPGAGKDFTAALNSPWAGPFPMPQP